MRASIDLHRLMSDCDWTFSPGNEVKNADFALRRDGRRFGEVRLTSRRVKFCRLAIYSCSVPIVETMMQSSEVSDKRFWLTSSTVTIAGQLAS